MANGWRIALAGVLAFLVVTLLVPYCRRFALAGGITDGPAEGKFHRTPTPYLGGVAIAVAAVGSAAVLPEWPRRSLLILVAACLMSLAGLVDDLRGLRAVTRVAIEIPAAVLAVLAGARTDLFGNAGDFVISVAFLVLLTNAFNLLDNMDGAAGAIGTTIAIGLATAALIEGQVLVGGLAVVTAATCLGFLVYNWHPAEIFMGDAGSLFLGFLLAVVALMLRTGVPHPASALVVLLLVGPALFDTTLVVISRTRARAAASTSAGPTTRRTGSCCSACRPHRDRVARPGNGTVLRGWACWSRSVPSRPPPLRPSPRSRRPRPWCSCSVSGSTSRRRAGASWCFLRRPPSCPPGSLACRIRFPAFSMRR